MACLPVGASAKKQTESLKEMKSTLKAVEKEWRTLFNEELANLELDLCVCSRRVEWSGDPVAGMGVSRLLHLQSWEWNSASK